MDTAGQTQLKTRTGRRAENWFNEGEEMGMNNHSWYW